MKNKLIAILILLVFLIVFFYLLNTCKEYHFSRPLVDLGVREVSAYDPQDPYQTDATPCFTATGDICHTPNAIACPREIPLRSVVVIEGKDYICLDRLNPKYNHRFDLALKEGAKEFGLQRINVYLKK